MSIFQIDHENIVIKRHKVLDRIVFTIDNFYKYPRSVLNYFKHIEMRPSHDYYPGNRGDFHAKNKEEYDCMWKHVNELKQILIDHGFDSTKFVRYDEGFEIVQFSEYIHEDWVTKKYRGAGENSIACNPHSDAEAFNDDDNILACVCYLSKELHGGTGIYKIRSTSMYCTDQRNRADFLKALEQKLSGVACDLKRKMIITKYIEDDYHRRMLRDAGTMNESDEHYELLHFFPMKFNRLIVYEGDLLHSIYIKDPEFFRHKERKTTNYTLGMKWHWDDDVKDYLQSNSAMQLEKEIGEKMNCTRATS